MKFVKKFIKHNNILRIILASCLNIYLRFVYATTRWQLISADGKILARPLNFKRQILVAWHNKLAVMPLLLRNIKNIHILASNHPDGLIIAWILKLFSLNILYGSTNRNATQALRTIIKLLKQDENIGLTPDGPRGPIYKINSNLVGAAKLSGAGLVITGSYISKSITLKSWDQCMLPLPFARGIIVVDEPYYIDNTLDTMVINDIITTRMMFVDQLAKNWIVD